MRRPKRPARPYTFVEKIALDAFGPIPLVLSFAVVLWHYDTLGWQVVPWLLGILAVFFIVWLTVGRRLPTLGWRRLCELSDYLSGTT
jgi:hypothetical protein